MSVLWRANFYLLPSLNSVSLGRVVAAALRRSLAPVPPEDNSTQRALFEIERLAVVLIQSEGRGRVAIYSHCDVEHRVAAHVLDRLVPAGVIEIHPADAAAAGVADGEMVQVSSRRGRIEIAAHVTERVDEGSAFLAFHYHEAAANALTISALDPIAKIPEYKVCGIRVEKLAATPETADA